MVPIRAEESKGAFRKEFVESPFLYVNNIIPLLSSVMEPDPFGSEIICLSGAKIKSVQDPAQDLAPEPNLLWK